MKLKRVLLLIVFLFIVFICYQYFYGGNAKMISNKNNKFEVLAHRGIHTNWEKGVYDPKTGCEAIHIYKPTHEYIENTIESIEAAFNLGATIVEIDIRRTLDDHLVIFHDDNLECRTNGNGKIAENTLAHLKTLDVGYGYTHDDGETFLFRGKGIGKMPTLEEVLASFPDKKFLIDNKNGDLETVRVLVNIIKNLPTAQQKSLFYWGTNKTHKVIQNETPTVKRLLANRGELKNWFKYYLFTIGLGDFPEESKNMVFTIPPKYGKYIWGWPYRFMKKVHEANAKMYLFIDTEEDAQKYANFPADGIVTDYIEIVGKYFEGKTN